MKYFKKFDYWAKGKFAINWREIKNFHKKKKKKKPFSRVNAIKIYLKITKILVAIKNALRFQTKVGFAEKFEYFRVE